VKVRVRDFRIKGREERFVVPGIRIQVGRFHLIDATRRFGHGSSLGRLGTPFEGWQHQS
jgi:hypothetical protein